jgi:hypothetical protein
MGVDDHQESVTSDSFPAVARFRFKQLGGLIGELTIQGPALVELWPVLWFGQWTHVGKGTAFGLGAYRLDAPV